MVQPAGTLISVDMLTWPALQLPVVPEQLGPPKAVRLHPDKQPQPAPETPIAPLGHCDQI